MMQKQLDWVTFTKLDNATTLDFLTTLSASLSEQQQFPAAQLDALKKTLATRSSAWSTHEKSITLSLLDEGSEAMQALIYRYGVAGFSLNHLRFALRPLMQDLLSKLTEWTEVTLKKTELVFNRQFLVRVHDLVEKRELFSQVIYSLSQLITCTMGDIQRCIDDIATMRPSALIDLSGSLELAEHHVALQMGFSGVDDDGVFSWQETRALRRLSAALRELSENAERLFAQLATNCLPSEQLQNATTYCELLSAEVQRFSGLTLPSSESTQVWEMRRQALCFSMYSLSQIISELAEVTLQAVNPSPEKDWRNLLSKDVERRLAAELFTVGRSFAEAKAASEKLLLYCRVHNTRPSELIAGELKKIDPILTPEILALLSELTADSIMATPGGQTSKTRVSVGLSSIRKKIANFTSGAAPILTLIVIALQIPSLASCGFKNGLKNNLEELRPAIPFRGEKPPEKQKSATVNLQDAKKPTLPK